MSERAKKLVDHFKSLAKPTGEVLCGIVKEVNGESCTVDVSGLNYYDVRMQARVEEGQKGFRIKPKIGSAVMIEKIDGTGDNEYFVCMMSEFESLTVDIEDVEMVIDANGFVIKKGSVKLRDVLDELHENVKKLNEELQKVVVAIGVSPNVAALLQLNVELLQNKSKSNDLLK